MSKLVAFKMSLKASINPFDPVGTLLTVLVPADSDVIRLFISVFVGEQSSPATYPLPSVSHEATLVLHTPNCEVIRSTLNCCTEHSIKSPQTVPFPLYPLLQVQKYEPSVFVQKAFSSQSFSAESEHSSTSSQLIPSPEYPSLHAHENPGASSVHVAFSWQLFNSGVVHSSMSLQVVPLPIQPSLQVQVYDPSVSVQFALTSQGSDTMHSLMFVHDT